MSAAGKEVIDGEVLVVVAAAVAADLDPAAAACEISNVAIGLRSPMLAIGWYAPLICGCRRVEVELAERGANGANRELELVRPGWGIYHPSSTICV